MLYKSKLRLMQPPVCILLLSSDCRTNLWRNPKIELPPPSETADLKGPNKRVTGLLLILLLPTFVKKDPLLIYRLPLATWQPPSNWFCLKKNQLFSASCLLTETSVR